MATRPDEAPRPYVTDEARASALMGEAMEETNLANLAPEPEGQEQPGSTAAHGLAIVTTESEPREVTVLATSPADARETPTGSDIAHAGHSMLTQSIAYLRKPSNARYVAVLSISLIALLVSLLNFGLITGSVRIPAPGLQTQGSTGLTDHATYGFEYDTDGWQARGAATSAVWNNSHRFAGQGALEVQVTGLTPTQKAFVYVTVPPSARPGSTITAHLYVPSGTPPLVATLYALDGSWAWSSGGFPSVNPGTWTALTYSIPTTLKGPIREMGVMVVGVSGSPPYTGVLFVDSVNVQN